MQAFKELPVIINGGGIAGLTFAVSCLQFGIKPIVIEKNLQYEKTVGQGIGIWGPALMALRSLGIEEKLQKQGRVMYCAGYKSFKNKENEWLVKPSPRINRFTSCLCLKRYHLQFALYEKIQKYEQIHQQKIIQFGSEIENFTQDEQSVKIKLKNQDSILEGGLLVGADGINSFVRNSILPEIQPEYSGYRYYQGITSDQKISESPAYESWGEKKRFGSIGIQDPLSFWFCAVEQDFGEKPVLRGAKKINQEEKNKLVNHYKEFGDHTQNIIKSTDAEKIVNTPIYQLPFMKQWHEDRVVLIGDACHGMAPNLGQGACLAIEDSLELASQLYRLKYQNLKTNIEEENELKNGISLKNRANLTQKIQNYVHIRQKRSKIVQFLVPKVHEIGSLEGFNAFIRNFVFKFSPSFIKTPIFDRTHQWALGDTYTAPNLGQGLYPRILGKQVYDQMPVGIKKGIEGKYHIGSILTGNVTVTRDQSVLLDFINKMTDLPQALQNGKVEVSIKVDENGDEHWKRKYFYGKQQDFYRFDSFQSMEEELFVEEFFGFKFYMKMPLNAEKNGFDHIMEKYKAKLPILKNKYVQIPSIFNPQIKAHTIGTDKGWKFFIQIKLPTFMSYFTSKNLILQYEGEINEIVRK